LVLKKELEEEQRIDGFRNNFNILIWELHVVKEGGREEGGEFSLKRSRFQKLLHGIDGISWGDFHPSLGFSTL
jgi:hypothetical protein